MSKGLLGILGYTEHVLYGCAQVHIPHDVPHFLHVQTGADCDAVHVLCS